jgi:hypothetical protein
LINHEGNKPRSHRLLTNHSFLLLRSAIGLSSLYAFLLTINCLETKIYRDQAPETSWDFRSNNRHIGHRAEGDETLRNLRLSSDMRIRMVLRVILMASRNISNPPWTSQKLCRGKLSLILLCLDRFCSKSSF